MRYLIALFAFQLALLTNSYAGHYERIITLAPHLSEIVAQAGAEDRLVGISAYSLPTARTQHLPIISDARSLDLERIKALQPDLIIIWSSGTPSTQQAALRKLFTQTSTAIFSVDPKKLEDIARNIRDVGELTGTQTIANQNADAYLKKLIAITHSSKNTKPSVKVFYQVWPQPLMTINREHIISDAIHTCGAEPLFSNEKLLIPMVSREAVIAANPDLIIFGVDNPKSPTTDRSWANFKNLAASRYQGFYQINSELISKPGPRILQGVEQICQAVEKVRQLKSRQE